MTRVRTFVGAATIAVLTAGCVSGAAGEETAEVREPAAAPTTVEVVPETTATVPPADTSVDDGADGAAGVGAADDRLLIAAVIVATGSLDEALEAGIVTPAEVEAAIVAVETGALGVALES